jgi:hypothetical protein
MLRGILVLAVVTACGGNSATEFPPGLEPLEDNTAEAPAGYEERLHVVADRTYGIDWIHARGFVHAPAHAVWAAVRDPRVMVNREDTDVQEVELGVEPEYDHSMRIYYQVFGFITVEWEELWRYGVVGGEAEAPELAMVRYQKVWGSDYIDLLQGSVLIIAVDDAITEVQFIEHLDALGGGTGEMVDSVERRFVRMVAHAHGQPVPVLEPR